ncbi:MAG: MalY/PatB family protein [Anaerolineaceae bacterium]
MSTRFDLTPDRRSSESIKWRVYDEDVIPMWIADMDFRCSDAILKAMHERVDHGVFGYPQEPPELIDLVVERLERRYRWKVNPEEIMAIPGIVTALNLVSHAAKTPDSEVIMLTPIYPPFLSAPRDAGMKKVEVELVRRPDGYYEIDFDAFEAAITPQTRIFLLCNPHNPVGRVFTKEELNRLADICLRHDVLICADEIHSDLLFDKNRHYPLAALHSEYAHKTVTLFSPSKTFNIAGLECSFAVVQNPELRKKLQRAGEGMSGWVNVMGLTAASAAYLSGQPWLDEALTYMQKNRDILVDFVRRDLPGVEIYPPEGTYLAWLDCRKANLPENPYEFFLHKARVAFNNGATFGKGGEGFIRLNFGCSRATLEEALNRMARAMREIS